MNARRELVQGLAKGLTIKCASFLSRGIFLKVNHTKSDYKKFLKELDFEYDDSYGCQQLHGTVFLSDGSWLSRAEYDGSEWWQHNSTPAIPLECL